MNPRVAKELRPLLLPWGLAAFAAGGYLVAGARGSSANDEFGTFLSGLAGVAFVTGCLFLTAMPLGFELHERTLGLLLSQPIERTRFWREKLQVAAIAVVALGIVHGLASAIAGQLRPPETFPYIAFMAAAVCSVGYWTLATRSILVGIASALSLPLWVAFTFHLVVYYLLGIEVNLSESTAFVLGAGLCVSYCALFLWLGHRQILGLELADTAAGRIAQLPQALVPRQLTELFRSRPTGAVANLIRKEVCLQRPIFLVSAIFTVGWLLTLLLMLVRPAWHYDCVGVLNGLTGTQVVLMAILTGCVSLGDDKVLGTAACHLTLPISARRQWFIKLSVAFATLVGVAIVLPTLLAVITLFEGRVGLLALRPNDPFGLAVPFVAVFVLSFWSASMVTNTVRAALTCMLALIGTIGCAFLGAALGELPAGRFLGLQSGLVTRILAHYQLPPRYFMEHVGPLAYGTLLICLAMVFAALLQSLRQFRRLQTKPAVRVKYAIILAAITFGGSFWFTDLRRSIQDGGLRLERELQIAEQALWRSKSEFPVGEVHPIPYADLEQTGALSEVGKTWLKNSRITYTSRSTSNRRNPTIQVVVTFPNGKNYSHEFPLPRKGENRP